MFVAVPWSFFFKHFVLTAKVLVSIVKGIICLNPYGAAQPSQGSSNLNKEKNRTEEKNLYRFTKIPFNCCKTFIWNRLQRVLLKSLKVAKYMDLKLRPFDFLLLLWHKVEKVSKGTLDSISSPSP